MANDTIQTASDVFDSLLPLGIQAWPDKLKEIAGILVFDITGDGGGLWVLDCMSTPPKIQKMTTFEASDKNSCTIQIDHESFKQCMISPNIGLDLYFQNKLSVSGNTEIALKMRVLFDITRRD